MSKSAEDEEAGRLDTYLGDSWFASVDTAVQLQKKLNANFIGIVKTSHSKFPKMWIEQTMKDWPPGSHIVLQANSEGVDLFACGYKYNKRKVCCFIFNKGAGHTEEGTPYVAKWKDENNNTRTREVPRPDVISKYFGQSNVVDVFNQSRQFDLKLEKHWVTEDGFFRLVTTLFGIVVTDCWKAYCWHLPQQHRHADLELIEFVRLLAKDLLNNSFSSDHGSVARALTIMDNNTVKTVPPMVNTLSSSETDALTMLSTLSASVQPAPLLAPANVHPLGLCEDEVAHEVHCKQTREMRAGKRRRRGRCKECGRNTRYYCLTCPPTGRRHHEWCCPDTDNFSTKRACHTWHRKHANGEIDQADE